MGDPTQDEWRVNERLRRQRELLRGKGEQALVEDPEMEGVDTIRVEVEGQGG